MLQSQQKRNKPFQAFLLLEALATELIVFWGFFGGKMFHVKIFLNTKHVLCPQIIANLINKSY